MFVHSFSSIIVFRASQSIDEVKSIFSISNIFFIFLDDEYGLPLAIAANLHVPYRIEIGAQKLRDEQIVDDVGKGNLILFLFSVNVENLNAWLAYLYRNNFYQISNVMRRKNSIQWQKQSFRVELNLMMKKI